MNKAHLLLWAFTLLIFYASAQDTEGTASEQDSIVSEIQEGGIVVDSLIVTTEIDPLAPSKAAFYSAILPGLGQVYNKRYWKVPLVYGSIGIGVYAYVFNNNEYNRFRDAFKRRRAGFTDDEFYDINNSGVVPGNPDISDEALQDAQVSTQRDRDLALAITLGLYVLNIVDANVDAHLKQYNVSDQLALDIKPFVDYNVVTTDPQYGLAVIVKF